MTITRFNIPTPRGPGDLPTGYDSTPSQLTLPSCGIEDVDHAVFDAFDAGIGFQVSYDNEQPKKPHVVFASGERWAAIKRKRGVRDANGSLILPIITIVRNGFAQDVGSDIAGRGINQQTGTITVHRRLDASDRRLQNLLNRRGIANQRNVAVSLDGAPDGQLTTRRHTGDLSLEHSTLTGAWLSPNRKKNVVETLTIPSPQFFTVTYEVTVWTQYVVHMNQVLERLVDAFLPQGNALRFDARGKGYWFIGTVEGNAFSPESNFDDMSDAERVVKHKFTMKVPAYRIAGSSPGAPVPVRRVVSSPVVTFAIDPSCSSGGGTVEDPYIGADDPTLPLDPSARPARDDMRRTGAGRIERRDGPQRGDPAVLSIRRGTQPKRYQRIRLGDGSVRDVAVACSNPSVGEASFRGVSVDELIA